MNFTHLVLESLWCTSMILNNAPAEEMEREYLLDTWVENLVAVIIILLLDIYMSLSLIVICRTCQYDQSYVVYCEQYDCMRNPKSEISGDGPQ